MSFQVHPSHRVLQHLREGRKSSTLANEPPTAAFSRTLGWPPARYMTPLGPRMTHPMSGSGAPRQDGQSPSGPLPLVGRTHELAALEALMEDRAGVSVMFVSGEGGVGKSRIISEICSRAASRGWDVAKGRAYPVETGVPYALFADAFLPILSGMEPSTLTVLSRGGEAELSYLFPALATAREDVAAAAGADPEEFRTRLMWNFAEFLRAYASRTPLLIALEDLQWADDSSLHLLHFLARQAANQPLLIVGTYNDAERDRSPQLVQTERSLVSVGIGDVQRVQPLTQEQVTELICRTFGVSADVIQSFSALLFDWTRGNPFFVEEIVKSLVASGRLKPRDGSWTGWDADDFQLPGTIRDAVLGRIGTFSADAQTVAELAAVIGTRAGYPLLASISGLSESELLAALEELCAHGVLDERAEAGTVVYVFEHPLVRQTLYGEFGLQRARVLHGAVAEAMEVFYGDQALEHADELAFHFARTDATHLKGKAAQYLAEAGRVALDRRADREAVNYLRAALERIGTADSEGLSRADIVPHLARAHQHLGEFEASVELWSSLLGDAPREHPKHAGLRRALGMAYFWCGRHHEAHEQLEVGLEVARERGDDVETVRLLIAEANGLQQLGRGQEALQALLEALPVADAVGSERLLARVHRSLGLLYLWIGPPAAAREHCEEAARLASSVQDASIEYWARWGMAVLSGMTGAVERTPEALERVNALAAEARSPVLRLWTAELAIEAEYSLGRWEEGLAVGEQAIALARNLHQRTLLPRLLVWTSMFHLGRGHLERGQELVEEAVEISGLRRDDGPVDVHQVVPAYIGLAHYLVAAGDYEDAIEAAEKGLRIAEGTGYILWAIHRLLPILAEACLWAGDIDRAESVAVRMREHAGPLEHRLGDAWAEAIEALVRWKRGDVRGSIGDMRSAAEKLEALPMIPYAARIRRQMAGRLADVGDAEGSIEELKRVHDTFVKLGAELELEKARMQFREVGHRPPPKGVGEGVAGLTGRELEIARLVGQRKSNKAIGKELGISPRTASTHLSNIFQKLGVSSRGELADLIRELDPPKE